MPPGRARKIGLFRFAFATILLPAIVLLLAYFGRNYAQAVNHRLADPEARSYFRSWIPTPTIRERPTFSRYSILRFAVNRYPQTGDPFLFQLTSHVAGENFDLSSLRGSSKYMIPEITHVSPLAERLLAEREFASLLDFCRELIVYGAFDDEKKVLLRYWEHVATEQQNGAEDDDSDAAHRFNDYVRYVIDTYTIPALLLFKERRVSRAEELLDKACVRLHFIPMTPLQFEGTTFGVLRERTLVLAALLEDELNAALYYDSVNEAVTCLIDGLPGLARSEWTPDKAGETTAINAFIAGLYLLDELRYEECIAQTAHILTARPSPRLLHLTLRIQLQCELKRRERSPPSAASNSLVDLESIYSVLGKSPYASELKYYRQNLGDKRR